MVEDDEQDANRLLEEGLEQALVVEDNAIDSFQPYVVDTSTSEAVQADAWEAYKAAAAEVKAVADTTWAKEKRRLFRVNCDALKAVEEWRAPLRPMNERERQCICSGGVSWQPSRKYRKVPPAGGELSG